MANDVLYMNNQSYFNIQKFEASIANRGIERQKRIATRKNYLFFDRLLILLFILLVVAILFMFGRILYEDFMLANKNKQIAKLETVLDKKAFDSSEEMDSVKEGLKLDNLKIKAYLELNMIMPTEKNIIYFDKSDSEYVRQYENIR